MDTEGEAPSSMMPRALSCSGEEKGRNGPMVGPQDREDMCDWGEWGEQQTQYSINMNHHYKESNMLFR